MTAPAGEGARILVVDDDQDLRHVLTLALADEGYEVRAAPNGRAALELLEAWRPRVIVLDLMMPELDGWAFRARQFATPGAAGRARDRPLGRPGRAGRVAPAGGVRAEALRPGAAPGHGGRTGPLTEFSP